MPVYRLTPVQGTEQSSQWRASSIKPHCLWIVASNEHEARREVAKATICQGVPETLAPWKDSELVACEYDESKDLAKGVIWIRNKPTAAVAKKEPPVRLSA